MFTVFQFGYYRIVKHEDLDYNLEDLKGDLYKPDLNPDISKADLKKQEHAFEQKVISEGVFWYELEQFEYRETGKYWKHLDSCGGFVGNEHHYIIDEFKSRIFSESSTYLYASMHMNIEYLIRELIDCKNIESEWIDKRTGDRVKPDFHLRLTAIEYELKLYDLLSYCSGDDYYQHEKNLKLGADALKTDVLTVKKLVSLYKALQKLEAVRDCLNSYDHCCK